MFSHYPRRERAALACLILAGLAASVPARADDPTARTPEPGALAAATTTLFPGGGRPPPPDPQGKIYEGNTQAISAGARLFNWYNCSGCHFHGAGGMGPSLMDQDWIYGGRIDQIHATLVQGRPNGMPSWAGKIPDKEMWEISAYVRSLSTPTPENGPGQTMPQTAAPPSAAPPPGSNSGTGTPP